MKKRVRCTAAFAAAVMAVSLLGGCGQDGVTAPEKCGKVHSRRRTGQTGKNYGYGRRYGFYKTEWT
mgnify:CR=1 FL=1